MAIPMLVGGVAKGLLGGAAKKPTAGAAKKFVTGKKKQRHANKVSEIKDVGKKVGAKVNPKKNKVQTVKLPDSVYKNQSGSTTSTSDKKVSFDSLGKQLDNINRTTKSLVGVETAEAKSRKELNKAARAQSRRDKFKAKEEQLEKKKGSGVLGGIVKTVGKEFGIFDFLTNIALGSLAMLALNNIDTITNLIASLSENFANPFKFLKSVIVGVSTVFAGPISTAFKMLLKTFKASGNLAKKVLKKIKPVFKKLFGGIGKGLLNFAKGIASKAMGLVGSGAKALKRGLKGVIGPVASQKAKSLAKIGSKVSQQATKKIVAKNVLGKGAARVLKIGKLFKRIPVIGGMLGIIIDLLLGEPLDRAVVGAVGGGMGAWIGGGIGSLVFPFAGTAAGAILGSMIGDWAGKALYEMIKNKMGLIPKVDQKDKGVADTGLTESQVQQREQLKPGQQQMVDGKKMVWNGLSFVTPQQYQQQTGKAPIPMSSTSTSSPQSTGPGSAPAAYTSTQSPSSKAQGLYSKLGITAGQWKTYKDTLASIETSGYGLAESYGAVGGSGGLYDGRYQMGDLAKKDAARILGISVPTREEFRNNPQLQEDMILAYTYANNTYMLGEAPTYDQADGIERLTYLGFGHNQGWSNAVKWLNSNKTLDPTRDGFGTSGTKFTEALRKAFGSQPSQSTLSTSSPAQIEPTDLQSKSDGGTGKVVSKSDGGTDKVVSKSEEPVKLPSQNIPNHSTNISSRPSYDPMSQRGGNVVPIPIPQQQQMSGGGGRGMSMGGPSTQQLLNSYYKSQLLGFLYKQG